jgi:hypothetical protein
MRYEILDAVDDIATAHSVCILTESVIMNRFTDVELAVNCTVVSSNRTLADTSALLCAFQKT